MSPRDLLRTLRRRWFVLALAAGLGVAAGGLVGGQAPTELRGFEATTVLLQRQLTADESTARPGLVSDVETVSTLLTVGEVPRRVREAIGYEGSEAELVARVRVGGDRATGLIRVNAVARDPERAVQISRAFTSELRRYLREGEREGTAQALLGIDERIAEVEAEIQSLAGSPPGSLGRTKLEAKVHSLEVLLIERRRLAAAKPDPLLVVGQPEALPIEDTGIQIPVGRTRMAILGALGLFAGLGLVIAGARLDTRMRSREDAERAFGVPVLAEIPQLGRGLRDGIVSSESPRSPAADAFGLLAYAIQRRGAANPDRPGPILVTSTTHGEGKTLVAVNLAAALAETGKRVLLISADFRSSTVGSTFHVPDVPGLSDAVLDDDDEGLALADVVRATSIPGLQVVTSGSMPERLGEMLSSRALHRVMREARSRADHVIVDSAPVLAARDAALLLNEIGSVLVVAGVGKVSIDLAERARELLEQLEAPVVGAVLNGSTDAPVSRAGRGSGKSIRRGKPSAWVDQIVPAENGSAPGPDATNGASAGAHANNGAASASLETHEN